jgi:hypothetical protein
MGIIYHLIGKDVCLTKILLIKTYPHAYIYNLCSDLVYILLVISLKLTSC